MILNINQAHFLNWLTEDYRMHEEEFNQKTTEEKAEIIREYEYHIELHGE